MKNILYIGSESKSRHKILKDAKVPFKVLKHSSDENIIHTKENFEDYVCEIAKEKMHNLIIPTNISTSKSIFVLTADTMVQTKDSKQTLGKPKDLEDGKRMLRVLRNEKAIISTGVCIDKKEFGGGLWHLQERKLFAISAEVEFFVPENLLDSYFKYLPHAMNGCGAGIIEEYGQIFLKTICGSYSAVLGLPIYEVRNYLETMRFFN